MALEVRYVPMIDEGDHGFPKIMRVVRNEQGVVIGALESSLSEAKLADPSCIAEYYNCLRDYFQSIANYVDLQVEVSSEVSQKMFEVLAFCSGYLSANPINYSEENTNG